ncbi:MAG TPA: hypothetical protein DCQ06_02880, partial [Myxococcales bacterium]|nr:hypothetical protein [Myxococcales bacterium]
SVSQVNELSSRLFFLGVAQLILESRPRPSLQAGPFVLEPRQNWPKPTRIAALIGAVVRGGHRFVATLLREAWSLPSKADERMLAPHISIEHLALGVRRERARAPERERWAALLVETHPSVVALLAANTRPREVDMVRLAAYRTQHPYALWAIALQPRWLASQRVMEAIVLNPACLNWMWLCLVPLTTHAVALRTVRTRRASQELLASVHGIQGGHLVEEIMARARRSAEPTVAHVIEVDESLDGVTVDLQAAAQAIWHRQSVLPSESTEDSALVDSEPDDIQADSDPALRTDAAIPSS